MQDAVRKMSEAGVEVVSGTADAVSNGVKAFNESVAHGDMTRFDAKNPMIKGVFDACAQVLEQAPKVVRKSYDVLAKDVED